MNYKIEKNEQFALVHLEETNFGGEVANLLEKVIVVLYREGYTNIIIDCSTVKDIDDTGLSLLRKATKICREEEGLLIIVTKEDELIDEIDSMGIEDIVILPTVHEATEAVFMNDLENDFRQEEDDEYGFDSEGKFEDY